MRLWSGAPYWLLRDGLIDPGPLPLRDCDVAVVGAGITGALLADALTAVGLSVTVIDRRPPAEGSTAACTGILTYEIDVELAELAERVGELRAVRAYRAAVEGVRMMAGLALSLPAACGFAWLPSIYFANKASDAERLSREADLRIKAGIDVEYLSHADLMSLYGIPAAAALRTHFAAVIDPVRLTRQLLDRAQAAGAVMCPDTTLLGWSAEREMVTVETSRGSMRARRIVFATGYETPPSLPGNYVRLHSSYALATQPLGAADAAAANFIAWNTERPYTYFRPAEGHRVVIGGADVPFRNARLRDRLLPSRVRALEQRLTTFFPVAHAGTEFAWAGTFGATADGLPYVGAVPNLERALFALGYGGNGIVFSVLAAHILRDVILGEGHEYLDLFSFDRPQ